MITIHQVQQGTEEWDVLRDGRYTGQNAGKLLKFGAIKYSRTSTTKFGGNFHTRRGHTLEDEAIELYEQIKKVTVQRAGFVTNDKYPNCGYSPDGLTEDRTIEVKAFGEERHKKNAEYLEFEIKAQTYFGQVICEKKLTDVLLYNPDLPAKDALKIITVKASRAVHSNMKRRIRGG